MIDRTVTLAARASFLATAEELTPLLAVDAEGARYLFWTADHHIGRSLFMKSSRGEIKLLRRAVRLLSLLMGSEPGGTFIDVGANIGTTTVPAVRDHAFTRAVACEPERENLAVLELNLVANRLERDVVVCPAAIGDSNGTTEFVVFPHRSGRHEVFTRGDMPADLLETGETITVRQTTLDTLAASGGFDPDDVGLLWMDAQGHEGHILRGARCLTERGVPIVMELDPDALGRHGGLSPVQEAAIEHYTHYVSLRRVRGGPNLRFDLEPTGTLHEEVEYLVENERFTDILIVRDPVSTPSHGGVGRDESARRAEERRAEAVVPAEPETTVFRSPAAIPARERREFLKKARQLTPLVAAEIEGATFIARTDFGADELPVFVQRAHIRLRILGSVLAALDELELGAEARRKTFVDVGAGVGIGTVGALTWHEFERAVACEADPSAYDALRLNLAVNDLTARAYALPVELGSAGEQLTLDYLIERGVMPPNGTGLVWAEEDAGLTRATALLESGPPLLLHLASPALADFLRQGGLAETHSHFARISKTGQRTTARRVAPIASLPGVAARGAERSAYVLAVRLDGRDG